MSERERVQRAVEGPVAEAMKLLDEARGADTETRLMILINGWGRGLSAGLEELALAIEGLRRAEAPEPMPHRTRDEPPPEQPEAPESADAPDESNEERPDEERLRARAADSRQATASLREEASSELGDDQETET
jgi:hypothetical protein